MSDKNDSAKFDTKRQGTVLCLDRNGIRDRGQRHRTVPCPGKVVESAILYAEDSNAEHKKFDHFWYYEAIVRYKGMRSQFMLMLEKQKMMDCCISMI